MSFDFAQDEGRCGQILWRAPLILSEVEGSGPNLGSRQFLHTPSGSGNRDTALILQPVEILLDVVAADISLVGLDQLLGDRPRDRHRRRLVAVEAAYAAEDRKSTRLNSSH